MAASGCGPGRLVRNGSVNDAMVTQVRQRLVATRGLEFRTPGADARASAPPRSAPPSTTSSPARLPPEDRARARGRLHPPGSAPPGHARSGPRCNGSSRPSSRRSTTRGAARSRSPPDGARRGGSGFGSSARSRGRDLVGELVRRTRAHARAPGPALGAAERSGAGDGIQHRSPPRAPRAARGRRHLGVVRDGRGGDPGRRHARTRARPDEKLLSQKLAAACPDVPPLLRDTLVFQYQAGTNFVDRLLARGGWPAVDRAQADPPSRRSRFCIPSATWRPARRADAGRADRHAELARDGFTLMLSRHAGRGGHPHLRPRASCRPRTRSASPTAGTATGWPRSLAATTWSSLDDGWDTERRRDRVRRRGRGDPARAPVERRGTRVLVLLGPAPPGLPDRIWHQPVSRAKRAQSSPIEPRLHGSFG